MSLGARVLRTIQRHRMLPPGGRVLVALSGGGDSVALVYLLRSLEAETHLAVAGLAHFNHQLRGAAADDDERFCREIAAGLSLPIEVGRADVREIARRERRSIEDAARRVRYAFLHEAAERLNAVAIAVGHSRDDQAETFLLRLLRGSGSAGLAGIRPTAGKVIRPLIELSRAELRQYAADHRLTYQEDATNLDLSVPRNRVRHELLPYLQREFSPGIAGVLASAAALARQDDDRLEAEAIDLAASIVLTITPSTGPRQIQLDRSRLVALHPSLASRVARHALRHLGGERFIGFEEIQRFLEFAESGKPGDALSLPGQQARLRVCPAQSGEPGSLRIELGPEPPRGVVRQANTFEVPLSIPGEVVLEPQQMRISASWTPTGAADPAVVREWGALVQGLEGPLAVRSRRPGDRFQPPGLGGRARKLQDYLVDRKVPRVDRDLLPLVVDRDDRIVCVVGHGVADRFRAVESSPGVIFLKAKYLGGDV